MAAKADELSLFPFKKEFNEYSWSFLKTDLSAALAVALLALPQAIANALLAGVPLTSGLQSLLIPAFIAALFGSSRHLVVGPSNATAILLGAGVALVSSRITGDQAPSVLAIVVQITFLTGLFQIIAALCHLGHLIQFVSHSVVVGYLTGTVLAICVNQTAVFLGISPQSGVHSLWEQAVHLVGNLNSIHWPTAAVGVFSMCLLLLIRRHFPKLPAPLLMFIMASLLVGVLQLSSEGDYEKVLLLRDKGGSESIFAVWSWPDFDIRNLSALLPVAFALALLSILETTAVSKTIAASSGQRLGINQEILALGLGNLFSSFIASLPVSGSASRSSLNYHHGAKTRFSALSAAIWIVFMLSLFGDLVMRIPLTALAALLLVSSTAVVRKHHLLICLKATSSDAFVFWITAIACIFLSLDLAFYIGTALSIILYLKKAAMPKLVEYEVDEMGKLQNIDPREREHPRKIRIIKVEGELFFGAADLFQTTLKTIAEGDNNTKAIILQLKDARDLDATACLALEQLHNYLKKVGCRLFACGLSLQTWEVLSDAGLVKSFGKEYLFLFEERYPERHLQRAIAKARSLIQQEEALDVEPLVEVLAQLDFSNDLTPIPNP